jgi:hypothetical protein|eukprot:COSAG01_NODE_9193_length_2525_cov_2.657049_2_plen_45_part_00
MMADHIAASEPYTKLNFRYFNETYVQCGQRDAATCTVSPKRLED